MSSFQESYLGRLRAVVGPRLLLVPGVRVVVAREDGAVLLQHRSDYRLWGLPGGVPDEGESAEACAIRETEEETGIRLHAVQPFGVASDPAHEVWTYPNGDRCHYFSFLYGATRFEGALRSDGDESLSVGWFKAPDWPDLMPVMRRTLDAHAAFERTGRFQVL